MDTSDGAIVTLDELSRLNAVGFFLQPLDRLLHPTALAAAATARIPSWFMLAGPHGEFELLFTVPESRVEAFRAAAGRLDWEPLEMGVVIAVPELRLSTPEGAARLDARAVRDAYARAGGDVSRYMALLFALNQSLRPARGL